MNFYLKKESRSNVIADSVMATNENLNIHCWTVERINLRWRDLAIKRKTLWENTTDPNLYSDSMHTRRNIKRKNLLRFVVGILLFDRIQIILNLSTAAPGFHQSADKSSSLLVQQLKRNLGEKIRFAFWRHKIQNKILIVRLETGKSLQQYSPSHLHYTQQFCLSFSSPCQKCSDRAFKQRCPIIILKNQSFPLVLKYWNTMRVIIGYQVLQVRILGIFIRNF